MNTHWKEYLNKENALKESNAQTRYICLNHFLEKDVHQNSGRIRVTKKSLPVIIDTKVGLKNPAGPSIDLRHIVENDSHSSTNAICVTYESTKMDTHVLNSSTIPSFNDHKLTNKKIDIDCNVYQTSTKSNNAERINIDSVKVNSVNNENNEDKLNQKDDEIDYKVINK